MEPARLSLTLGSSVACGDRDRRGQNLAPAKRRADARIQNPSGAHRLGNNPKPRAALRVAPRPRPCSLGGATIIIPINDLAHQPRCRKAGTEVTDATRRSTTQRWANERVGTPRELSGTPNVSCWGRPLALHAGQQLLTPLSRIPKGGRSRLLTQIKTHQQNYCLLSNR
jgi:hypothetical protein